MRLRIAVAAAALAGCTPPEQPPAEPAAVRTGMDQTPAAPAAAPAALRLSEMAGHYRVAGIDGTPVNLPHAITVSIDEATIRYVSQCVTGAWTYQVKNGSVVTQPIIEAVCDRGRYPEELALDALFSDPRTVRRTQANGIEIAGGGHSATLFSQ